MITDDVGLRVRLLLARVLERDPGEVEGLPDSTPLFGSGVSLDSLTGLELLEGVRQEFGVDIASEDLNLDSLETIGTLVGFLSRQWPGG
ncbi:MAG: acyl carrier protein [Chloroflexia bacterium]